MFPLWMGQKVESRGRGKSIYGGLARNFKGDSGISAFEKSKCSSNRCIRTGCDDPAHKVLLGNGIYIIENVDKLDILPPFFGVIGLPCRLKKGSGSTLRLIALIDK